MANVRTFDLIVYFNGYYREYYNISRAAVNHFLNWHRENPDYVTYMVMNY